VTPVSLYLFAGAALFAAGLWAALARAHLFWKVLGLNVMGSGVFLVLLASSPRLDPQTADPVPQAMVLTGVVVAVAATAVALGMSLRVTVRTGLPFLVDPDDRAAPAAPGEEDA
jgi:multicomponent Na+:H+ antiporter subunit C